MTPQEKEMISGLIDRVQQTKLGEKDTDAESMLQQALGRNPDALYILAQTVLVQKYALDQAQGQLTQLKSQLDQARQQGQEQPRHTSFLGSLLGHNDPPPPPPPPRPIQQQSAPQYAPVQGYAPQPGYVQSPPQYGAPIPGGPVAAAPQGGGFLRGAMQTAAGVAAGALAFQGVESLMHGFGHSAGYGNDQALGSFGGGAPHEEIINNYYGDSGGSDRGGDGNLSSDIEDRRGDNFADTANDSSDDNSTDSFADNSGSADDSSSFDSGDSGSFDSGMDDSSFSSGGDDSSF